MRGERSRVAPLPREIAIDQVRAVARASAEARGELFEERQLAGFLQREERAPGHLQLLEQLRDGVTARAHAGTSTSSKSSSIDVPRTFASASAFVSDGCRVPFSIIAIVTLLRPTRWPSASCVNSRARRSCRSRSTF